LHVLFLLLLLLLFFFFFFFFFVGRFCGPGLSIVLFSSPSSLCSCSCS